MTKTEVRYYLNESQATCLHELKHYYFVVVEKACLRSRAFLLLIGRLSKFQTFIKLIS